MDPHVSIIILNWNSFDDTTRCVDSVLDADYKNYQIHIIDNNSKDESKEILEGKYNSEDKVTLHKNSRNLGFSAGCNVGIKKSIENKSDYILLLNNDTIVSEDFLDPLVNVAEKNDDVGLVGGVVKYMAKNGIWYAGGHIDRLRIQSPQQDYITKQNPYETGFVTGALMLIKPQLIDDIGLLNEDYFFGMEDKEYSLKAREAGWKLMVAPGSVIWHKKGGSTDDDESPFQNYHSIRNNILFSRKTLPLVIGTLAYIRLLTITILRILRWSILGENRQVKAALLAYADYYRNVPAISRGTELLDQ